VDVAGLWPRGRGFKATNVPKTKNKKTTTTKTKTKNNSPQPIQPNFFLDNSTSQTLFHLLKET